jgi:hypothetical protein
LGLLETDRGQGREVAGGREGCEDSLGEGVKSYVQIEIWFGGPVPTYKGGSLKVASGFVVERIEK